MAWDRLKLKTKECRINQKDRGVHIVGTLLKPNNLKKFDGNCENWIPFWEQFKAAVHESDRLDASSKFNFLQEVLVGKAALTIAGFLSTRECYYDAIEILLQEYGNKGKVVENYIEKILGIKAVASVNDTKALRRLYEEIITSVRTLSTLEVPERQYNIMTSSIILKALLPATKCS